MNVMSKHSRIAPITAPIAIPMTAPLEPESGAAANRVTFVVSGTGVGVGVGVGDGVGGNESVVVAGDCVEVPCGPVVVDGGS